MLNGQQVVQIDVDADELGRNYDKTFGIEADASQALEALHRALVAQTSPRPNRRDEVEALRRSRSQRRDQGRTSGFVDCRP